MYWTQSGSDWTSTEAQRTVIVDEIAGLEWHDLPVSGAPACQGLALGDIIKQASGKHVAVAWNGVLNNRYGLLGLTSLFKNGEAKSYWIDVGTAATCLCVDFVPHGTS
jgi:hypothetical protein